MTYRWIGGALMVLGLAQMVGDLTGVTAIKGVAAATCASPAPKVFSAVRGFETYSTRFYVEWPGESVAITPALAERFEGPYNRRNVYGAALAYGPVMPQELRDPVMRHALCGERPILRELGIDVASVRDPVRVRFEPRPGTDMGDLPAVIEARCP